MDCFRLRQGFGGHVAALAMTGQPMTEEEPIDEIAELEARIEELAEAAERCRKFILASKIAIGCGAALLLITILDLPGSGSAAGLGSIALVLGGIVSLGSNISTLRQANAAIGAAEALRSELISRIDLRVVHDAPMKLV
jgi:hypothetical protein